MVARGAFLPRDLRMRASAATALKQSRPEARTDTLARRQLRMRLGERPLAPLAAKAPLAPAQDRRAARQRQIANPHDRSVLDRQRRSPAPPTTRRSGDEFDLQLKLATDLDHPTNDHPLDAQKAANVVLHLLFLLGYALLTTRSLRRTTDVYPRLNPARSARPLFLCPDLVKPRTGFGAGAEERDVVVTHAEHDHP